MGEVDTLTASIEDKTRRIYDLGILKVVDDEMKAGSAVGEAAVPEAAKATIFNDTTEELAESKKSLANLDVNCEKKQKE